MNLEEIRNFRSRTILRFSIPSIIAMVLTSFITVADGFFIGNYVGSEGIAAVNLGIPIVYLFLAAGLMVSVGGMAISEMSLGENDIERCAGVFNQTMCTVVVLAILLSGIMQFALDPILRILNADALVGGYFKDYYRILLLELPIMVINSSFGMFVRGEGKPQYFMGINVVSVALNILLDYVFVRWCGWGIRGVAFASLLSVLAALFMLLDFFVRRSGVYKFRRFAFSGDVLRNTLLNGSSEFVGELSMSISMFAYNFVILRYISVDGVTAFTVVGYISYIFSMIILGFGQGVSPLISFTYGAGERLLAADLRRRTARMTLLAGMATLLLVVVFSEWYSRLFVGNDAVAQMARTGAVIFATSFLFAGINTIASFYFTSIGRAMESAVISSARGLVILLICIFTLPPLLGMTGVWLVAPIAEALTLILSFTFITLDRQKLCLAC